MKKTKTFFGCRQHLDGCISLDGLRRQLFIVFI